MRRKYEVRWGSFRRIRPFSTQFGFDRGQPVDRYYIENFLEQHKSDIKGRVLEIAENLYTRKFGGNLVTKSDILHTVAGSPNATLVADLTTADNIQTAVFDCIILTQTLLSIYDFKAAIKHCFRILKPAGVLLATFPGISQISRYDMDRWGDYWRFTTASAQRVFTEFFPPNYVEVGAYGNILTAIAFLHGLAAEELKPSELNSNDPDYEVLITIRAVKPKEML